MAHIMYRNNKANLWLRTICVSVALLGMLFFTHSQFSSAAAPTAISVSITTSSMGEIVTDGTISFSVEVTTDEASKGDATLIFVIGSASKTVTLSNLADNTASPFTYTGDYTVVSGDNGAITFTSVAFATSVTTTSATYTGASAPAFTPTITTLMVDTTVTPITDVTSVAVVATSSGTGTDVQVGETVSVEVTVTNAAEGIAVVADGAATGDTTGHTLQYKIADGDTVNLPLARGSSDTVFTGMFTVDAMTGAGAFTFESVTLIVNNMDGDGSDATKVYTTATTPMVSYTDPTFTIVQPAAPTAVTDVTVLANATIANNTAKGGDNVTFTAWVTNSADGIVQSVTVNFKIVGDAPVTGTLDLTNKGANGTSTTQNIWNGTSQLADNVTAGNLSITNIVVWANNSDNTLTKRTIFTAATAKATNVVTVEAPAPVANTTTSVDTSATSSGETTSDSPVSIFTVFVLIASVSVVVGVYTLRRRQ